MEYYKIRNLDTKLYSSGGSVPTWKKTGKIWPLSQLRSHLTLLKHYTKSFDCYKNCELVCFTEVEVSAKLTLEDLIVPLEQDLVAKKLAGHE